MNGETDAAVAAALEPLFAALEALERIERRLHPPDLGALVEEAEPVHHRLRDHLAQLRSAGRPQIPSAALAPLTEASEFAVEAFTTLSQAPADPNGRLHAYRALRLNTKAQEALYRLAPMSPAVSRFFVEPDLRDDPSATDRLLRAAAPAPGVGVSHVDNDRDTRGGYSLYVPEYYDSSHPLPLIVALHGGSGHGADFLWTWLREARTLGAIVLSPTSKGRTWSLRDPEIDTLHIETILNRLLTTWNIDTTKLLLTGMSDGGTFSYLSGLRPESPFTHLAVSSASFHPSLLGISRPERLTGLPVYVMHGERDWMFPVALARMAGAELSRAGAKVVLRIFPDLSHTYPRQENPKILRWLLA